jgi:hypothetical protein
LEAYLFDSFIQAGSNLDLQIATLHENWFKHTLEVTTQTIPTPSI